MPINLKKNHTKVLYKTKFLNLLETKYNDDKKWVWVQRAGNTRAVMIVPFVWSHEIGEYKIVVIKEKRIPLGAQWEWGFPAGLVEENEDIEDAAKRELKEETGLEVLSIVKKSPFTYNSAGLTDESIAMVFVEATGELTNKNLEETEEIQSFLCSKAAALALLNDPNIKIGSKAWIILDSFCRGVYFQIP